MATLKVPIGPTDHIQGDPASPVTLVEYGDYECPYCGRAYPIVKKVQRHFGQRLALVFRNFPLSEIHPHAQTAAESAEFAAAHDRFWEMHDGIYENHAALGPPLLLQLAETLKLPIPALRAALESHEYAPRIRTDFLGGVRSGVNGTPTFFINGQRHDASFEFDELVAAIEAALAKSE